MLFTSLSPNIDSCLFVEKQDENRNITRYPVILFAGVANQAAPGALQGGILPIALINGELVASNAKLVRIEE